MEANPQAWAAEDGPGMKRCDVMDMTHADLVLLGILCCRVISSTHCYQFPSDSDGIVRAVDCLVYWFSTVCISREACPRPKQRSHIQLHQFLLTKIHPQGGTFLRSKSKKKRNSLSNRRIIDVYNNRCHSGTKWIHQQITSSYITQC